MLNPYYDIANKNIYKGDGHIHVESDNMTPYTAIEFIQRLDLKAALVDHVLPNRNRITPDWIKMDCKKKFLMLNLYTDARWMFMVTA